MVEELVAEPRHGPRDRHLIRMAQAGAGGEETVELATQRGLGASAEFANHGGGLAAVRRGFRADGRNACDDRRETLERLSEDREVAHIRGR